jgi:hypothetical protein
MTLGEIHQIMREAGFTYFDGYSGTDDKVYITFSKGYNGRGDAIEFHFNPGSITIKTYYQDEDSKDYLEYTHYNASIALKNILNAHKSS